MNDRYKFRVWDKVGERMIVDVQDFIPLKITNKGILRLNPLHEENLYTLIEFGDPFIPMQCIGLKDKNGALIFEGDICFNPNCDDTESGKNYRVIYWEETWAKFSADYFCSGHKFMTNCEITCEDACHWEVVGNIYENAGLI